MPRALVVALLLANLGWLAWSQGALRGLGLGPETPAESEPLARQVRPEALSVRPLAAASAAPVAAPASMARTAASATVAAAPALDDGTACLQAGTFDEDQAAALRAAAALPSGSWRLDPVQLPDRWMVYVGRLADAEAVRAKRAELRELGVDVDRPGAALRPQLAALRPALAGKDWRACD